MRRAHKHQAGARRQDLAILAIFFVSKDKCLASIVLVGEYLEPAGAQDAGSAHFLDHDPAKAMGHEDQGLDSCRFPIGFAAGGDKAVRKIACKVGNAEVGPAKSHCRVVAKREDARQREMKRKQVLKPLRPILPGSPRPRAVAVESVNCHQTVGFTKVSASGCI
jgi:hypothetical protein